MIFGYKLDSYPTLHQQQPYLGKILYIASLANRIANDPNADPEFNGKGQLIGYERSGSNLATGGEITVTLGLPKGKREADLTVVNERPTEYDWQGQTVYRKTEIDIIWGSRGLGWNYRIDRIHDVLGVGSDDIVGATEVPCYVADTAKWVCGDPGSPEKLALNEDPRLGDLSGYILDRTILDMQAIGFGALSMPIDSSQAARRLF